MKSLIKALLMAVMVLGVSGCYGTGLSLREKGSMNYSNFIYGLYGKDFVSSQPVKRIHKPIKLAVAQVGENTPPATMLEKLKKESHAISKVVVLPAGGDESNPYYSSDKKPDSESFEKKMEKMRQLAKDLDTDYIFLFGGSADIGETQSWLGFWDITLIGAFIIPSHDIIAEGRATGALIDVESGRPVFAVNA